MARLPYTLDASQEYVPLNVLKILSLSSATFKHWAELGSAQFKDLELPRRERELVILLSTSKFPSTYEWTHHVPISAKFGITDVQREELSRAGTQKGYFASQEKGQGETHFTSKEMTLLLFVEAVIEGPEVSDALWERVKADFSEREIVEVISLQGFYYMFSRLTTVLQIEMDDFTSDSRL
ncbi:hypothetical protein NKR23_g4887 [Pleurostoma richardsiae]|uniref:Carboxymuconolactone decarboxylase-like domain-containing protein n=1 Tax=Pleurostoma richardsiae TaxID=41990 RepID=A0AA38VFB0_9PEZI|nr:hypothetical protein NKR23_g4887 [Pleurostoma richardsiae]